MPWSRERVVLIASRREHGHKLLGTGTMVASGRILTARHVVFAQDGTQQPDIEVRREGTTGFVPARVGWPGSPELDLAVLAVDTGCATPSHPLALLTAREIGANENWEVEGYPSVRKDTPSDEMEKVGGVTRSWRKSDRMLLLDATTHPGIWGGLSGAAVVIGHKIVGVVRSLPAGWDGERISATPVAAFLEHKAFREALGLGAEDDRLAKSVGRVLDGVARLLEKRPHVLGALIRKLPSITAHDAGAKTVASELVTACKATDVAKILNHVDADFAKSDGDVEDRRVVRTLLWQILPFALDWRQLVVMGLSPVVGAQRFLELPLRSETVAEIVLAGIDDRFCRFATSAAGAMPVGAALVRMPAAAQSALFDIDGSRLAQLVVQQLAAEVHIEASYSRYPDLRDAVEGTLRYYAHEAPDDEILPYYLLFVDADVGGNEGERGLWAVARSALSRELPSLRLVRLTGGSLTEETLLAKHVEAICGRMP